MMIIRRSIGDEWIDSTIRWESEISWNIFRFGSGPLVDSRSRSLVWSYRAIMVSWSAVRLIGGTSYGSSMGDWWSIMIHSLRGGRTRSCEFPEMGSEGLESIRLRVNGMTPALSLIKLMVTWDLLRRGRSIIFRKIEAETAGFRPNGSYRIMIPNQSQSHIYAYDRIMTSR